uniref:Replication protein A 70 kDa DNA-binding subunit B/D first OB fold domain-containing protein n=1 Tax=Tanacetum cinerariifolium TaxID=118510 RepID=A0A6L2L5W8_TANCI|nr:hypothetical protein [Tanacetum cinerariifolium]
MKNFDVMKGVLDASNITMLKDVNRMLDNITVHGRCISLWHSHRLNEAHNPHILDMVLHDSKNSSCQVYKKEWMFRFEPLFQEGQCYSISDFAIAENSGMLPLLPHKYKISFYKGTIVIRIDSFDNNVNGFILEPFNRLLDGTRQYHEHEVVVVAIGDIVPIQYAVGRKIRRTVVIEDSELKELPEYDETQFKISLFTPQKPVVTIPWSSQEYGVKHPNRIALSTQRFTGYTKKIGGPTLPVRSVTRRSMLLKVKLPHLLGKAKLPSTVKTMVSYKLHLDLVGKRFLFKIFYSDYNVNNNHTYRCDAVNDDPTMIKHFKDIFLDEEDDEGFTTPASQIRWKKQLKPTNGGDLGLNRVIDMETPNSGNEGLGSGSGGSSVNKRVFIDLDDIDSEEDEGGSSIKTPKLVTVKVEKEDP